MWQSVCLSDSLSVWQSVCPCDSPSVWQSVFLCDSLSVCRSLCDSLSCDSPSVWQSVYLSDSLSVWQSICVTVCLCDSKSVWQYICVTVRPCDSGLLLWLNFQSDQLTESHQSEIHAWQRLLQLLQLVYSLVVSLVLFSRLLAGLPGDFHWPTFGLLTDGSSLLRAVFEAVILTAWIAVCYCVKRENFRVWHVEHLNE